MNSQTIDKIGETLNCNFIKASRTYNNQYWESRGEFICKNAGRDKCNIGKNHGTCAGYKRNNQKRSKKVILSIGLEPGSTGHEPTSGRWPVSFEISSDEGRQFKNIRTYLEFISISFPDYYHYFTDLIKCVDENYVKSRKLRAPLCFEKFLKNEIEMLNPEKILCLGYETFELVRSILKKNEIPSRPRIYRLLHYSGKTNTHKSLSPAKGLCMDVAEYRIKVLWPQQAEIGDLKTIENEYFKWV